MAGQNGQLEIWAVAVQLGVVAIQVMNCWHFTRLHSVQSLDHTGDNNRENFVRVLSANVKMSNRRFGALLDLVRDTDPDIVIAMEIDDGWLEAIRPLKREMSHSIEWPCSNSFGIAVLSKLPLIDSQLRFLVFENVPSVRTGVRLRSHRTIRLYAVHPEPPVPYEDTVGRDGELSRVAREVMEDPLPVIVSGDLNDVGWSRTTRRFQRLTGLLDPRVGRGFFNTFDARFPLLRWPLDHVFHDAQFRLVSIQRLRLAVSDHFPIVFELALHGEKGAGELPHQPTEKDHQEAGDVVSQSLNLNRLPVGNDWENVG